MSSAVVSDLALTTMIMSAKLTAPMLIASLVVGFVVSLFQSITQIREVTLAFVPKTIVMRTALYTCEYWVL